MSTAEPSTPASILDGSNAASAEDQRGLAESALAAGDIAGVRAALDALVTRPLLSDCATALRAGRVEEALAVTDVALAQSPALSSALYLNGVCQAALADRAGDMEQFQKALDTLTLARDCGPALIAASRIARSNLRQNEPALELAREGARLGTGDFKSVQDVAALAGPSESADRALALAALALWRERASTPGPQRDALFEEAQEALSRALLTESSAPWAWLTLGSAYLEAGRPAEALAALENGLDRMRDDSGLFDLIAKAAFASGGTAEVVRVFARVQAKRPEAGLAWWYPGLELFNAAVRREGNRRAEFAAAELDFRTSREKYPALRAAALRNETLCRTGLGWIALEKGDLDQAWNALRSAGEYLTDGLELSQLPGLPSAARGLERLIELHLGRGELIEASRAAELLTASAPSNAAYARQAGNLQHDLGDRWQLQARDFKSARFGRLRDEYRLTELRAEIGITRRGDDLIGTEREKDMFWRAYVTRELEAKQAYEQGLAALRRALELTPEDLLLGRDTTALAVYRVQSEVAWAEVELLRLVQLGEHLLAQTDLDTEQRIALEEAWGDAHEQLGIIFLDTHRQPSAARAWFEKSVAIGPMRRAEVLDTYLPACAQLEADQQR